MRNTINEPSSWQAVIDAHALESHDPEDWLLYGVALLQTMEPGPDVGKQLQQAALAFVQAQKEGASAEAVAIALHAVLISERSTDNRWHRFKDTGTTHGFFKDQRRIINRLLYCSNKMQRCRYRYCDRHTGGSLQP